MTEEIKKELENRIKNCIEYKGEGGFDPKFLIDWIDENFEEIKR